MVLAGDIVRAGDAFTDWTTFNPTLLNASVGAGTKTGSWRRCGPKTIDLIIYVTFGTGGAVTGAIGFTLPAGLTADGTTTYQMLPVIATDISATSGFVGAALMTSGGGTNFDTIIGPSNTVTWTTGVPFPWAAPDRLLIQGTVRVTT